MFTNSDALGVGTTSKRLRRCGGVGRGEGNLNPRSVVVTRALARGRTPACSKRGGEPFQTKLDIWNHLIRYQRRRAPPPARATRAPPPRTAAPPRATVPPLTAAPPLATTAPPR